MGYLQPKEAEGKREEAIGCPNYPHDLKDRVGAKFQSRTTNVVNPKATGEGKSGNPGIPV